jgi:hypothetical protein
VLALEYGRDYKTISYQTIPRSNGLTRLMRYMLESWKRKRYGAHQTIDVNYGGVVRLEKDNEPDKPVLDVQATEVFNDEP